MAQRARVALMSNLLCVFLTHLSIQGSILQCGLEKNKQQLILKENEMYGPLSTLKQNSPLNVGPRKKQNLPKFIRSERHSFPMFSSLNKDFISDSILYLK